MSSPRYHHVREAEMAERRRLKEEIRARKRHRAIQLLRDGESCGIVAASVGMSDHWVRTIRDEMEKSEAGR